MTNSFYRGYGKRMLDVLLASAGLICFSPSLLILVLLVRTRLGTPVLFRQERPGLNGKTFILSKFRTMTDACGSDGQLLPDDQRLTRFGQWLRSSSLDELPELWNVLKGEMSLVGPRPLRTQYLDRYTAEQARRHHVIPGLTGWAQVNGRNSVTWEERFEMDVWYVDHVSFQLDMKIIWLTIKKVLARDGVSPEGQATMPEFFPKQSNAA